MVWDVDPAIFKLGGFELRYYPLCFIFGFLLGQKYATPRFLKEGFEKKHVESVVTHLIIGTVIGARLGHCLFYEPEYYLSRPWEILMVWKGGLASHGGFTGVMVSLYFYLKKWKKMTFFWLVETLTPAIMFVAGLIRIGNLFNSEIVGKVTDVPWAFVFTKVDPNLRHPTQIYESIGYFSISAIMYYFCNKYVGTKKWPPGRALGLVFIISFTFRFFIEFFKIDQVAFEQGMSINMGQWLSVPFVLAGIYLMTGHQNKLKIFDPLTKPLG